MAPRRSLRISAAAQRPRELPEIQNVQTRGTGPGRIAKRQAGKAPPTTTRVTSSSRASTAKRKSIQQSSSEAPLSLAPSLPSTPTRKQRGGRKPPELVPTLPSTPPPFVPPLNPDLTSYPLPDLNRPVDPLRTNATLVTPHGSHITAYPRTIEEASPSKTGLPRPTATTGNLLSQGLAHLLKVEPKLRAVIEKYPSPPFSASDLEEEVNPFASLASGIIGQQVSGAAAKSIKKKFIALFSKATSAESGVDDVASQEKKMEKGKPASRTEKNDYDYGTKVEKSINENDNGESDVSTRFPNPEDVVKCDLATLRTAGLSQRKAEYIHGLAEKFVSGELSARMLLTASDEEVLEKLIAVRGLGKWSVEMFSVFGLKRMDVFSTGDLGIQ